MSARYMTYAEQQRADKRSMQDGLALFAVCVFALVLLCIAFMQALDKNEAREQLRIAQQQLEQARSDERLARTGSRLCFADGRTLDTMRDDEPLHGSMRADWCK